MDNENIDKNFEKYISDLSNKQHEESFEVLMSESKKEILKNIFKEKRNVFSNFSYKLFFGLSFSLLFVLGLSIVFLNSNTQKTNPNDAEINEILSLIDSELNSIENSSLDEGEINDIVSDY